MRKISLLFACFLLLAVDSQAQWKKALYEPHAGITFVAINAKNPSTVFSAIGQRWVRSYDKGDSWQLLNLDTSIYMFPKDLLNAITIHPIDTNIILACGDRGIYLSKDNGWMWTLFNGGVIEGGAMQRDPHNPDIIYTYGYFSSLKAGVCMRSQDKGFHWDTLGRIPSVGFCSLAIRPDSSNIIFGGSTGQTADIYGSWDSGNTWKKVTTLETDLPSNILEIPRITFISKYPLIGFAVVAAKKGGLYQTTDGGYTWNRYGFKDTSLWEATFLKTTNKEYLFIAGLGDSFIPGSRIVRSSTDYGKTWFAYDNQIPWDPDITDGKVWMIAFSDTTEKARIYVDSKSGLIVSDTNAILSSVIDFPIAQDSSDLQLQASGDLIRIHFQSSRVNPSFRIANLLGETVAEGKLNERDGDFAVGEFSLSGLPHGVYIAQVSDGKTSVAKVFVSGD